MLRMCSTVVALVLSAMLTAPADAQTHPLDAGGYAEMRGQPEYRVYHCGPSVDGVPLHPERGEPATSLSGRLNMVGLNIGISAGGVFGWAVFAPTTGIPAGALAGEYVGASGDIGLGIGVGANVLIGGSARTLRCSRSHWRARSVSTLPLVSPH